MNTRATFAVHEPATGALVDMAPNHTAQDATQAIERAHAAWPAWRSRTAGERAKLLRAWHDLILAHREPIAVIMSREAGKVMSESRGEVDYGAAFVEWFAEEARRTYGDVIPSPSPDRRLFALRQSVGVVAAITPWNFPLAMITRKVAPALAAGCPVIIKPATETPLTALYLERLAHEAGIPADVYQTLTTTANAELGAVFLSDARVRKVSFTGSTAVGKQLVAQSAQHLTKLSLELGGNAPILVFEDADIDAAVRGTVAAKFRHNGQTCVCVNRVYVHESVHEAFIDKFTAAVQQIRSGNPSDDTVQVGPLISERALHKVEGLVADAVAGGARIALGGVATGGQYYAPTVLVDVRSDMRIAKEEVFGPVAPIYAFRTEAEAIALANDTSYGLAAYLYSSNQARCWRVAEALEYGMVGINESLMATVVAPFGGIKESGIGREGSRYGMDAYLEMKYVCLGGLGWGD
ncbi:MAG: NAD-dependent succinate-semialdehyde dehydrogenase [Gemmatimonadaceae bacterium]|nr:NAD-dependent succinate-semialdehyde dehydrogenase [Gemmatimonadaceae bacterium]